MVGRLMFGVLRPRNPTPGTMFAGKVVRVGAKVSRFSVGDDVFGSCDNGAHAEYVAVGEGPRQSPRSPAGVAYEDAAAVPYGASTALAFLRDVARVQPGHKVLIVGAAGGVGRFAVQIARHLGAEVTAVCAARDAALARELGAGDVIDYKTTDYTRNGKTYDVILDTVTGDGFRKAKRSLTETGRYATVYITLAVVFQMLWTSLLGGRRACPSVVLGDKELSRDVARATCPGCDHAGRCSPLPARSHLAGPRGTGASRTLGLRCRFGERRTPHFFGRLAPEPRAGARRPRQPLSEK